MWAGLPSPTISDIRLSALFHTRPVNIIVFLSPLIMGYSFFTDCLGYF
jgi:hypothetical protein